MSYEADKVNVANFYNSKEGLNSEVLHATWPVIELGQDIMPTNESPSFVMIWAYKNCIGTIHASVNVLHWNVKEKFVCTDRGTDVQGDSSIPLRLSGGFMYKATISSWCTVCFSSTSLILNSFSSIMNLNSETAVPGFHTASALSPVAPDNSGSSCCSEWLSSAASSSPL